MLVVLRNLRVARIVDEFVPRIHIRTADDHNVVNLPFLTNLHRPRRTTFCVSSGEMSSKDDITEAHFISVMQDAVDFRWLEQCVGRAAVLEVALAAVFYDGHIAFHHHVLRTGELLDEGAARAMIEVGMADQQDFDIAEAESQVFDVLPDRGDGAFEIAIDENVALRCRDQVGGQVFAADVIDIGDDLVRWKRLGPLGVVLRKHRGRATQA